MPALKRESCVTHWHWSRVSQPKLCVCLVSESSNRFIKCIAWSQGMVVQLRSPGQEGEWWCVLLGRSDGEGTRGLAFDSKSLCWISVITESFWLASSVLFNHFYVTCQSFFSSSSKPGSNPGVVVPLDLNHDQAHPLSRALPSFICPNNGGPQPGSPGSTYPSPSHLIHKLVITIMEAKFPAIVQE